MNKYRMMSKAICPNAEGNLKILVEQIGFKLCIGYDLMKSPSMSRTFVWNCYYGEIKGALELAKSLEIISWAQKELFEARAMLLLLRITGKNESLKVMYQKQLREYSSKC